jgi:hypothetical protein
MKTLFKYKSIFFIILSLLFLNFTSSSFGQTFTKIWETDSLLDLPESALYDAQNNLIYVSNIGGKFSQHDGNGFISKIGLDGKILELKWAIGFDSPQGLGLFNNHLFVADMDRVVVVDIKTGKTVKEYKIEAAKFLNDVTTDKNGDVFVSDCVANKIYRISNDKVELWSEDPLLNGTNGLLCHNGKLYALNMGNGLLYSIDQTTKTFTELTSGIKNADGIVSDGNDGYFFSGCWQGEIFHIKSNNEKTLILDLGKEKKFAADIEYITSKKLLLVPTLAKTVVAYTFNNDN